MRRKGQKKKGKHDQKKGKQQSLIVHIYIATFVVRRRHGVSPFGVHVKSILAFTTTTNNNNNGGHFYSLVPHRQE